MSTDTTTTPKRPVFRLAGIAEIKHLNVRKEGPDDEKILAVDVKLAFTKVDRALCAYFDEALEAFLWRAESGGIMAARNGFMHPVAYANAITSASVKIDGASFVGCEVKKFALQPRDGGTVDVTCSVSLYPSSGDIAELAKRVQDGARVEIEGPPDLFDGDGDGGAAAAGNTSTT
ncbi:MAG: hypothetical protein ACOVRP_07965 [Gemmatimonas sp.]|jgi:hypothetical protein